MCYILQLTAKNGIVWIIAFIKFTNLSTLISDGVDGSIYIRKKIRSIYILRLRSTYHKAVLLSSIDT